MSTSLLRRLRPLALVALAAAVLAPRLVVGSSAAAFTDSASASSNTVTADFTSVRYSPYNRPATGERPSRTLRLSGMISFQFSRSG